MSDPGSRGLPALVHARNRRAAALFIFAVWAVTYLGTNHFHLRDPRLLPLLGIDSRVPFVPGSVWIYNSEFLYFAVIYLLLRDDVETFNKYCYSMLSLVLASGLIFLCWPTTYPRGGFPLPEGLNAATAAALGAIRLADTPANCCPSLHVSSVYLSALVVFDRRRKARSALLFAWGTLIALSTLTTKQHYAIDVLSGFGTAVLFYGLFHRALKFDRHAPESAPCSASSNAATNAPAVG